MKRPWLIAALLGVVAACNTDKPRETFIYTDAGESDGSRDVDDDGGSADDDAGRKRRGFARFCQDTIGRSLCTEAELQPALDCYNDVCEPQYEECDFVCSAYIKCLDACDCADRRCVVSCEVSKECVDCRNLSDCDPMRTCEPLVPECLSADPPDRSCEELATCCRELRGSAKDYCEETVAEDTLEACSGLYVVFCTQPE